MKLNYGFIFLLKKVKKWLAKKVAKKSQKSRKTRKKLAKKSQICKFIYLKKIFYIIYMASFSCKFCNYITKRKNDFNKHLTTKKHFINQKKYEAKVKKIIVSPQNDLNSPQFPSISPQFTSISPQFPSISEQNVANISHHNGKENYNCKYCNKKYTRIDNLNRHIAKTCKKKKEFDEIELKKKYIFDKQNQIIESQSQQIVKFEKMLEKTAKQVNNTQNNDNSNNKTINNIHINNYGEENLEMLTDDFKKQCVRHPYKALVNIIERIHFNDEYPENKNIRLLNKRDNKIQVKDNGKWNYKNKEKTIRDAIDDSNIKLEQFYQEKSKHFRKIIRLSCKEIIKNVQESDTETLKNMYKELDIILFNN